MACETPSGYVEEVAYGLIRGIHDMGFDHPAFTLLDKILPQSGRQPLKIGSPARN